MFKTRHISEEEQPQPPHPRSSRRAPAPPHPPTAAATLGVAAPHGRSREGATADPAAAAAFVCPRPAPARVPYGRPPSGRRGRGPAVPAAPAAEPKAVEPCARPPPRAAHLRPRGGRRAPARVPGRCRAAAALPPVAGPRLTGVHGCPATGDSERRNAPVTLARSVDAVAICTCSLPTAGLPRHLPLTLSQLPRTAFRPSRTAEGLRGPGPEFPARRGGCVPQNPSFEPSGSAPERLLCGCAVPAVRSFVFTLPKESAPAEPGWPWGSA